MENEIRCQEKCKETGGDHYVALVENLLISGHLVETQVRTTGYGGVVFWYQDI
jgi:hypothetical protein